MPVKIQVEAVFRGVLRDLDPQEQQSAQQESMYYHGLMKDNILVKMSAFG